MSESGLRCEGGKLAYPADLGGGRQQALPTESLAVIAPAGRAPGRRGRNPRWREAGLVLDHARKGPRPPCRRAHLTVCEPPLGRTQRQARLELEGLCGKGSRQNSHQRDSVHIRPEEARAIGTVRHGQSHPHRRDTGASVKRAVRDSLLIWQRRACGSARAGASRLAVPGRGLAYFTWIQTRCWLASDNVAISCQMPELNPVALVSRLKCHWSPAHRN